MSVHPELVSLRVLAAIELMKDVAYRNQGESDLERRLRHAADDAQYGLPPSWTPPTRPEAPR